jgi:hypothetical protein
VTLAVGSELLTIYGMLVIALLALLRIAQRHSTAALAAEADTIQRAGSHPGTPIGIHPPDFHPAVEDVR